MNNSGARNSNMMYGIISVYICNETAFIQNTGDAMFLH